MVRKLNYKKQTDVVVAHLWWEDPKDIRHRMNLPIKKVRDTIWKETRKLAKFNDRFEEIVQTNNVLLLKIDDKLLEKLEQDDIKVRDLIALKDLVVKQNRLIQGESTENIANVVINFDANAEREKTNVYTGEEAVVINQEEIYE